MYGNLFFLGPWRTLLGTCVTKPIADTETLLSTVKIAKKIEKQ